MLDKHRPNGPNKWVDSRSNVECIIIDSKSWFCLFPETARTSFSIFHRTQKLSNLYCFRADTAIYPYYVRTFSHCFNLLDKNNTNLAHSHQVYTFFDIRLRAFGAQALRMQDVSLMIHRTSQTSPKMSYRHSQDIHKRHIYFVFPRYPQCVLKTSLRHTPDIPKISPDISKISPRYLLNIPKDIPKTPPRYTQITPRYPPGLGVGDVHR